MSISKGTPASSQIVWLESRISEQDAEITALRARLAEVEGALREVISVSDRKTDIYDRAKAALASAGEEAGMKCAVCRGSGIDPNYVLARNCRFCDGTGDAHMPTPITPPPLGEAQS